MSVSESILMEIRDVSRRVHEQVENEQGRLIKLRQDVRAQERRVKSAEQRLAAVVDFLTEHDSATCNWGAVYKYAPPQIEGATPQ